MKWGISSRRVQAMCCSGLLPGAFKVEGKWAIPIDAKKPIDGRVSTGNYINWRQKYCNKKRAFNSEDD